MYQSRFQNRSQPNEQHHHSSYSQQQGGYQSEAPAPESDEAALDKHFQIKIFGKSFALNVFPTRTKKGWHTLTLEAAGKPHNSAPNDRRYDWQNKTVIQLTMTELPVVTALLHSLLPSVSYSNHGQDNSKGFSIEKQERNFFVKLWAKDSGVRAIPVPFPEMALIANLALSQYTKNFENVSSDMIFKNLQTMARDLIRSGTAPVVTTANR